jgi:hypothetical protein
VKCIFFSNSIVNYFLGHFSILYDALILDATYTLCTRFKYDVPLPEIGYPVFGSILYEFHCTSHILYGFSWPRNAVISSKSIRCIRFCSRSGVRATVIVTRTDNSDQDILRGVQVNGNIFEAPKWIQVSAFVCLHFVLPAINQA